MSYYESIIGLVRGSDAVAVLREHALCPSGYVREAVLRRCVALNAVTLLPVVVARLHDWVPQVRLAAREALVGLMPLASAAQLAAVLPEILRLRTHGRGDSAAWLAGFETTLLQTLTPGELCAVARGPDRKAARAAVSLIDRHGLLAPTAIVQLILDRRDDIVLAQRAIELSALLPPQQQVVAYRAAASSHFGAVRTGHQAYASWRRIWRANTARIFRSPSYCASCRRTTTRPCRCVWRKATSGTGWNASRAFACCTASKWHAARGWMPP